MNRAKNTGRTIVICLLLGAAVFAVFGRTIHCEFVNFDDNVYVYENPHVKQGLTLEGILWTLTHREDSNWHPLTTLSHMLDCQLYGSNAGGHHLTSVVFHVLNAILLFLVLRKMTMGAGSGERGAGSQTPAKAPSPLRSAGALHSVGDTTWRCALVAAVFALHPLRVESVAWVTERKDVLSGLFFFLTLYAYTRYAEIRNPKAEIRAPTANSGNSREEAQKTQKVRKRMFPLRLLRFFAANSASSPTGATPVPAASFGSRISGFPRISAFGSRPWYFAALLFFALGLMAKPMLVTLPFLLLLLDYWPLGRFELRTKNLKPKTLFPLLAEKTPFLALSAASCIVTVLVQKMAIKPFDAVPLPLRLENVLVSCITYLGQTFWPVHLGVFYPFPEAGFGLGEVALAGLMLAGITLAAVLWRTRRPWILFGWLWFLGMLVPVIGLVQVGDQSHADRYTYLPQLGILVALVWTLTSACAAWRYGRLCLSAVSIVVLVALGAGAYRQTAYWQNSRTLWARALAVAPHNFAAHSNLASALNESGEPGEAVAEYEKALAIKPDCAELYDNLGIVYLQHGQWDQAILHFQKALALAPADPELHRKLGDAFFQKGRYAEAITQFQAALATGPNLSDVHNNLGIALAITGQSDQALAQFQAAVAADPRNPEANNNLGKAFLQHGHPEAAIPYFQSAVAARPDFADAHNNLANALLARGQLAAALPHFERAAALQPQNADALNHLAWLLAAGPNASLRNRPRAVELALRANQLSGGVQPMVLRALAAAYAEAGRFPDAIETARRALKAAGAPTNTPLPEAIRQEIQLYEAGKPFRDTTLNVEAPKR